MFDGYLCVGGTEVGNNARARGYAESADCPVGWFVDDQCEGLADALGDAPYTLAGIADAPWFDPTDESTHRFYGAYITSLGEVSSSSRVATVTEGILDGGVPGRSRHAGKSFRVRAWLTAAGQDALEAGHSWLNSALEATDCGTHSGGSCGASDITFFTACPPGRRILPDFGAWTQRAENLFTNPSFEAGSGTVEVRRNLIPSPDTSTVGGWSPTAGAGTLAAEGGRLKFTSNGSNLSRLGGLIDTSSEKPAGTYVASYKAEALSPNLTGVRVYLYHATTGNLYQQSLPIVAGNAKYEFTITAAAAFNRVYVEFYGTAITSGDVGYISEPLLESGSVHRAFFRPGIASPDPDLTASWTDTANASESILTGVGTADVGNPYSGARGFQSSQWASTGAKSLRITPWGTGGSGNAAVSIPVSLLAGKTYTFLAKVRLTAPLAGTNEAYSRRIRVLQDGGASFSQISPAVPNEAGVHEIRWTMTTTSATGTAQLWHGGSPDSPDIWWDDLLLVEGIYDGPYFDGGTYPEEGDALRRTQWMGTPDASISTLDTRLEEPRPQTDAEYQADLDPLIRHMHDVICISGPLEIETRESSDGVHWGRLVEFTLYAGKPWMYSVTRDLELSPTPATVVQDTPFNLVPMPSAETAGSVMVAATNYSLNPSVESNSTGWSHSSDGTYFTNGIMASGRVTGELQVVGSSSFRAVATTSGSSSGVPSNTAWFCVQQEVDISTRPANSRVSISLWAASVIASGAPVREDLRFYAFWRQGSGGTVLRTDLLGTVDPDGGAVSVKSIEPPAGATHVLVRAQIPFTSWGTGNVIRLYADALAVTVP